MPSSDLTRPDPADEVMGESRARVLATLQDAGRPLSVGEIAAHVGLHPNTARFHLDALVDGGFIDRATEDRVLPGRPRMLYQARPGGTRPGRRSYHLLAEILTSFVAAQSPQATKSALEAGRSWGRYLTEKPPPFRQVDATFATEQLVATLDEIGFAPEAVTSGGHREIRLRHCPFRETAERHPEVVCAIHLGLMKGVLQELDAPLDADRLDPFVEPSLCVAHLSKPAAKHPAKPAATAKRGAAGRGRPTPTGR